MTSIIRVFSVPSQGIVKNSDLNFNDMIVTKDKVVELEYELTVDGKVVDKTTDTTGPLDYIHGENMLLPKFEEALEGLEPEAEFAFTLAPEDGYGEYDPKKKVDIAKSTFEVEGVLMEELLQVGRYIPLLNSAGMVVRGKIDAIHEDKVTMDFNDPMAGKTLNFKGKVVSVRDATEKELTEGLHGEFLPKEGGCCGHHGNGGCCHGKGHEEGHECCHGGEHNGEHECHCHHDGEHEGEHECHCHHDEGEGHHECHCHEK